MPARRSITAVGETPDPCPTAVIRQRLSVRSELMIRIAGPGTQSYLARIREICRRRLADQEPKQGLQDRPDNMPSTVATSLLALILLYAEVKQPADSEKLSFPLCTILTTGGGFYKDRLAYTNDACSYKSFFSAFNNRSIKPYLNSQLSIKVPGLGQGKGNVFTRNEYIVKPE